MPGNSARDQVRITADDVGPLLAIITWFFMTMMILAVLFRLIIKLGIRGKLKWDDHAVCAALVFGVVQSIVISASLGHGLGKRKNALSSQNITVLEQTIYAADLLFVLACGTAKISLLLLLRHLASIKKSHRIVTNVSIGVVAIWMLSSVLALAFQCGSDSPWETRNGQCLNKFSFWVAIGAIDMVTEVVIIVLPVIMMLPLRLAASKKAAVIVAFVFRIGVSVLIIIRLVFLHKYSTATDFSFDGIPVGISTQILISLAITTACIPALKPFLDSFDSGALNIGLRRTGGTNTYELHSRGRDIDNHFSQSQGSRTARTGYLADVSTSNRPKSGDFAGSIESGKSDEMIIKRTDQWTVTSSQIDPTRESYLDD